MASYNACLMQYRSAQHPDSMKGIFAGSEQKSSYLH